MDCFIIWWSQKLKLLPSAFGIIRRDVSSLSFGTFESNVQTLTLIRLSWKPSGWWWNVSLILSRWWHNMIYGVITLSRISSWSCRRSSGLFMFSALNLIFNKFMSFSLSAFYDSVSRVVGLFMLSVCSSRVICQRCGRILILEKR